MIMKKVLLLALMLFSISLAMNAQKIKWDGVGDVEWNVKRCYVKNDRCVLDLLLTNNGSQNIKSFLKSRYEESTPLSVVYDDEGNNYEYWFISRNKPSKHIVNGETSFNGQSDRSGELRFEVPAGLAVKARIVLSDFDEFATKLSLVKLIFGLEMAYSGWATLEIRDIPVTRE